MKTLMIRVFVYPSDTSEVGRKTRHVKRRYNRHKGTEKQFVALSCFVMLCHALSENGGRPKIVLMMKVMIHQWGGQITCGHKQFHVSFKV
jgi:hypothetical protein